MRYFIGLKLDESFPFGPPPPALFQAIAELGEQATKDGTLLEQGGLLPSAAGALVHAADGRITVVDGPFAEAKELIGGYAIYELRSKDEAIEAARRFLDAHLQHWPGFVGTCEIRQMMDFESAAGG